MAVVDAIAEIDRQIVSEEIAERCADLGYDDDRLVGELVRQALYEVERNGATPADADHEGRGSGWKRQR